MKVIFSENARADLRSIALFIARDNVKRAKPFSKELRTTCQKLSDNPKRFALAAGLANIRKRVHGSYVIYYRVDDEFIDILHIFHGAIDMDETELFEVKTDET